jgi:L-fucose isomerase
MNISAAADSPSHFKTVANMPVTLLRLNIVEGVGLVLQIAEGHTITLPDKAHNILDLRTDRSWPTTWFTPVLTGEGAFKDTYSVMANWGANHGVSIYGHRGADLITLGIDGFESPFPCIMSRRKRFSTAFMAAFGTIDQQAADYSACKHYGPIYG